MAASSPEPVVLCLKDLPPQPVTWLWPGRIARGKLCLLDGDPGQGKSLFTLDLCARVSQGQPFPDGQAFRRPGNVLLLCSEDDLRDTVRPRIDTLGGNAGHVFAYQGFCHDDAWARLPVFPRDLPVLGAIIRRTRAELIVIDPLMSYLDAAVQSINDQSVRQALTPMALVAECTGAAILLVRHLNKTGGSRAIYRGGGSIGIIGSMRTAFLLAPDPEEADLRILACTKCNLGPKPPSLAFRIEAGEPHPTLRWHGESELTADQLVGPARQPPLPREQAEQFLRSHLEHGSMEVGKLKRLAAGEGISAKTLIRVKQGLGVRTRQQRGKDGPIFFWSLTCPNADVVLDPPLDGLDPLPGPLGIGPGSDRL